MKRIKLSLRVKTTIYIFLGSLLMIVPLIIIVYKHHSDLIKSMIGRQNVEKAFLVSGAISRIINEEIADVKYYISEEVAKRGIEHHYGKIQDVSPETIKDTYLEVDSRWSLMAEEDPAIQEILQNPLSLELARIVREDDGIDEILVSDRYGGLIAASSKASDYYQADEEWWQKAYNGGKGTDHIRQITFDESSGTLSLPVVYCLKDANESIVLIAKILLNPQRVFSPFLEDDVFDENGKGGHFAIINDNGEVLIHEGLEPLSHVIKARQVLSALKLRGSGWLVADSEIHQGKILFSFYKVKNSLLEAGDIVWFAVNHIDTQMAFAPVNKFVAHIIYVGFLALGLSVFLGLWLGKKFTDPLYLLVNGVNEFGKGNLEYRVVMENDDEFSVVAKSLNDMAENLNHKMTTVDALNRALDKGRESEANLKKSQENFKNIIQNNIFGVLVVDEDGRCLFVNVEAENILGKPGRQLLGNQIGLPVVVGEKSEVNVFGSGHQKVCEMRAAETVWQGQNANLIILRDITEEKENEQKIRESEERYRSFINVTGQVAWITDANGQVNQDLPEWREFTGQRAEEILGAGWAAAIHPDDMTAALQVWREAVEEKRSYETEYRLRRHDGMYRSMLARGVPVFNDERTILEWIGVCIDITEHKQLEYHVRVQEQILRNVINTIPAFVFWKDINAVYLGCNQLFAKGAGLSDPEEIKGKTDYDLAWTKEEADNYRKDDREVMDGNQAKLNIEETQLQDDGNRRDILTNKVPLRDEQGVVVGILGTFMDISRMKEMEAQMSESHAQLELMVKELEQNNQKLKETQAQFLQAEKMAAVGQLSAGVAHEVKNPLAIISLAIDSLKDHIPSMDEKIQRYFRMITESTERANKVIMDLMDFARYSEIELRDVKILEAVNSTIRLIENSARIKGVEIIKDFQCPEDILISGDIQLMEQVFLNLLGNALDAITAEKGTVTVRVFLSEGKKSPEKKAVIEISDTGCGISKEHIAKVFNPFFTTKQQGQGTGLGLSTVFMIIENHEGTIQVASQEGKGTTFIITLPLQNYQD